MTAQNYREIVNVKNVNACNVIGNIKKFPMFSGALDYFNMTYPGLIQEKCPFKVKLNFFKAHFNALSCRKISESSMRAFHWFKKANSLDQTFQTDFLKRLYTFTMI